MAPKSHSLPPGHLWRAVRRDYPPDVSTGPFFRAFAVGYGIALGPEILKALIALVLLRGRGQSSAIVSKLARVLRSGFRLRSFALFLGLAFGGGRWLERFLGPLVERWRRPTRLRAQTGDERQAEARKAHAWTTFASSTVATLVALLIYQRNAGRKRPRPSVLRPVPLELTSPPKEQRSSPTLDLTLFALVRAVDTLGRAVYSRYTPERGTVMSHVAEHADLLIFWVSCWRIMWCWFYLPTRLPPSYVKWITNLARMDVRLLRLLRQARAGTFFYGRAPGTAEVDKTCRGIAENMGIAHDLCMPDRISTLPCHVVHGKVGDSGSCEVATLRRWRTAWLQSMGIYLPVHAVPRLLFGRQKLVSAPIETLTSTLLAAARSSAFLATFVASIWASVCLARTRLGPRLFPSLPQQAWDGGLAPLLGCMACGLSVLIENKRRRGEMALYVAPRALYAILDEVLPAALFEGSLGRCVARWSERAILSLSMGAVTTAAVHEPELVRGVVRGVLSFMVGRTWRAEGASSQARLTFR